MKTRSWIIATLGSYLTALAFRHPLVQDWLARYVPGEPAAETAQVTIGVIVGAVLLIVSAALAARFSGARNRLGAAAAGAVAGLLAGGVTFGMYGAPAAGVAGARPVYPFTVEPAQTDAMVELVEAILGCFTWTYGLGWAMLLGGGVVGALVGVIAGASPVDEDDVRSSFAKLLVIVILAAACCVGLVVNMAIYSLLSQAIAKSAAEVGYTPSVSPSFTWYAPVGSSLVVLITVLLLTWLWGRRRHPATSAEAWRAALASCIIGGVAILAVVIVLVMDFQALFSITGVGLVAVVALGVLLVIQGYRYRLASRQAEEGQAVLPGILSLIGSGLAGGTILASLVPLLSTAIPYNLTLLVIPVIPTMIAAGTPPEVSPPSASELALTNYTVQVVAFLRIWGVLCAAFVVVLLLTRALIALRERRRAEVVVIR
jgi:hypothetical protein